MAAPAASISFAADIKPLFRDKDREAMLSSFDLWEHTDVADNADSILDAVAGGSMPCDDAWSQEQVDLLQRWIDAGAPA